VLNLVDETPANGELDAARFDAGQLEGHAWNLSLACIDDERLGSFR
jgi:hypothetical protein